MRSLRDLLPKTDQKIQGVPLERVVDEKTIFFLFDQVIEREYGKRGRAVIFPVKYVERLLTVKTKTPLWANELFIQKGEIIAKLNASLGQEAVTDVKVVHGATSGSED